MKPRRLPNFDDIETKPKLRVTVIVFSLVIVLIFAGLIWAEKSNRAKKASEVLAQDSIEVPTLTSTPLPPTPTQTSIPTKFPTSPITGIFGNNTDKYPDGVMILSLADGYYKHLFAYHPSDLHLTRITDHPWDDIQPAISPDGTRIAYTSRRNGFWDIYVFNLKNESSIRVTDSLAYDGNPSWAPDGQWLAYESYINGNLDIYIQSLVDLTAPPLQLTDDLAPDFDPAWSPAGNEIAFTSLRSGEMEIWTAAVDRLDNRFLNRSDDPGSADSSPAWSPDGSLLGWTSSSSSGTKVLVTSVGETGSLPKIISSGSRPLWSPDGGRIIIELSLPNSNSIAGLDAGTFRLMIPAVQIETEIFGMDWKAGIFGELIEPYLLTETGAPRSLRTQDPASRATDSVTGRTGLVPLDDVGAPHPLLSDSVNESFDALRTEIARLSGWDVLGNLENAYLPLTDPLGPGSVDDWLLTGLAFSINPLPYKAGWMVIQREDIGGEVYWRVYIRARYQDGSQGIPLDTGVWDLDARSSGDTHAYEAGGAEGAVPSGYWVDLTELANRFGWERLPALNNWRTFFESARFNQFAFTRGMTWETAMLELYPSELVHQPTRLPSITSTPTSTTAPLNSKTATAQAGSRLLEPTSPNPRPTWTPPAQEDFP